jgi:hypothetical protein
MISKSIQLFFQMGWLVMWLKYCFTHAASIFRYAFLSNINTSITKFCCSLWIIFSYLGKYIWPYNKIIDSLYKLTCLEHHTSQQNDVASCIHMGLSCSTAKPIEEDT